MLMRLIYSIWFIMFSILFTLFSMPYIFLWCKKKKKKKWTANITSSKREAQKNRCSNLIRFIQWRNIFWLDEFNIFLQTIVIIVSCDISCYILLVYYLFHPSLSPPPTSPLVLLSFPSLPIHQFFCKNCEKQLLAEIDCERILDRKNFIWESISGTKSRTGNIFLRVMIFHEFAWKNLPLCSASSSVRLLELPW